MGLRPRPVERQRLNGPVASAPRPDAAVAGRASAGLPVAHRGAAQRPRVAVMTAMATEQLAGAPTGAAGERVKIRVGRVPTPCRVDHWSQLAGYGQSSIVSRDVASVSNDTERGGTA